MVKAGKVTIKCTSLFEDTLRAYVTKKRRMLHQGGTSSSKTISILQFLIIVAHNSKVPMLISVVSESLPHLKRGCIRDFFKILGETPDSQNWSKTEFTYTWPHNGVQLEFFGADDSGKVRGPRREILFINEGNNVSWEAARGLDVRTTKFTIVDWNPVGEFWAHDNWLVKGDDGEFYGTSTNAFRKSTYLDALEVLPPEVVANIESNKDKDPNWWNIFGLGLLGKVEGLVHPSFQIIEKLPEGNYFYGLDYGFSSDPSVLTKNVIVGDNLYSQQLFYDNSGLTNPQIAQQLELLKIPTWSPIYADPSEPKSSEEIRTCGFNCQDSVKGAGSKLFGIKKVNNYYQYWTRDSVDCIKDQRNYRWIKDPNTGLFTDKTTHQYSHGVDSRRYACAAYIAVSNDNRIPVKIY